MKLPIEAKFQGDDGPVVVISVMIFNQYIPLDGVFHDQLVQSVPDIFQRKGIAHPSLAIARELGDVDGVNGRGFRSCIEFSPDLKIMSGKGNSFQPACNDSA